MPRFTPAALSLEGKGHFYLVPWDDIDHNLSHPSLPLPAFSYFFLPCRALTIFIPLMKKRYATDGGSHKTLMKKRYVTDGGSQKSLMKKRYVTDGGYRMTF